MVKKLLTGKVGVVMGVANIKSIAWGIAMILLNYDAVIVLTCSNNAIFRKISPLIKKFKNLYLIECNILKEDAIQKTFDYLKHNFQKIDFLVYSIAFSDKKELRGKFIDISKENFLDTMSISCYSFVAVVRQFLELLKIGASILTLTYYGSTKVIPHYNVMGIAKAALETSVKYCAVDLGVYGIRVNAISAGPIKTLAASSISNFTDILNFTKKHSPLRKGVNIVDIGNATLYFVSDLASAVTGEVHFVDAGYNILGFIKDD